MNSALWHLLLNHLPIVVTLIGTTILVIGYLKNKAIVKQTALGFLIVSAITAISAYLTGGAIEEIVEKMPSFTERFIYTYEDIGKAFLMAVLILGILSLVAFISNYLKKKISTVLNIIVLVASLGTCVLAKQVSTSGGEVRHTEIRKSIMSQGITIDTTKQNNDNENEED